MVAADPPRQGLLEGLRVVEIGTRIAAPIAGLLLAEQGAEVIRVMTPGAADGDPVLDALLARGKMEAELDPGREEDRAMLQRLVAAADVVIENLEPGRVAGWGIDFEELRARANPRLVSCSSPPFEADDPRSELPDHEALSGMAGLLYEKPLGPPRYHDFPIGSVMAGLFAANGIMAALVARERLGHGQHIGTTLRETNLFAQILSILIKSGMPRGFLPFKMVGTPFMGPWLCKGKRYIYLHITLPAHNARILEMLEELGYRERVRELRAVMSDATARDPSQVGSIGEAKKLKRIYQQIFLTRTPDEWEELLGQELCCIKIRTAEEWLRDAAAAGMSDSCTVDDPLFGELMAPGAAVVAPEHPPVIRSRVSIDGELDQLVERWTERPASEPDPGAAPEQMEHPLQGIRVLDLSRVIAGPCAARILAELGAEVISVQSPTTLDWALSFHLLFNAGKKSVTLDFTTGEGKEKLWDLMDDFRPHAFIQNYRHLDLAKTIGVDPEAIHARDPRIAYTHLNAYGNEGIWKDRPGFEQVVQAVSGIQMAYGRGGVPRLLPTPVIDIGSGLLGAFATLLGIYRQMRTGAGTVATTHLTTMALFFQVDTIARGQRKSCIATARAKGRTIDDDAGREVIADIVRTREGHVCVAGPRDDLRAWLEHAGIAGAGRDDPLVTAAKSFRWRGIDHWRGTVEAAGVGATVALIAAPRLKALLSEPPGGNHRPRQLRRRDYPGCPTPLAFVRAPVQLSLTPTADVAPPPMRGAHTAEILGRIGVDLPPGSGIAPYPESKPFLIWLGEALRWAYFAWRSGNI